MQLNKALQILRRKVQESEYEVCVLCGKKTNIPKSRPVESRSDYLPGAGQLCHECAIQNADDTLAEMRNGLV